MKKNLALILGLCTLLSINQSIYAASLTPDKTSTGTLTCTGQDGAGTPLTVTYDPNNSNLTVNGTQSKLFPSPTNTDILYTSKYTAGTGVYVYSTFNTKTYLLTQYNGNTNKIIVSVSLTCK